MGRLLLAVLLLAGCHDPPAPEAHAQDRPAPTIERPQPVEPAPEPTGVRAHVKLITLGSGFPGDLTDSVERRLREELQVDVERIEGLPLPRFAYYPPRRRYRAEKLLVYLNRHLAGAPASTRVLGLTTVDISTTKGNIRDWGIFGLGELGGRSCVISTFRLRRRARDDDHLHFRVTTTAVHEVGHTLGLEHCEEPRCLMNDAHGSIATVDNSTGHLGPECTAELNVDSPLR